MAVRTGGRSRVKCGSTMATAGWMWSLYTACFPSSATTTETRLASAPVPAVVGMAISGQRDGSGNRSKPK